MQYVSKSAATKGLTLKKKRLSANAFMRAITRRSRGKKAEREREKEELASAPRYTIIYVILQITLFSFLPFFNLFKGFPVRTEINNFLPAKGTLREFMTRDCINF